jgi:hypothetical protein
VYGLTEADFFGSRIEKEIAPWELDDNQMAIARLMDELHTLPQPLQSSLVEKFRLMVETATAVQGGNYRVAPPAGPGPGNNGTRDRSW